MRLSDLSLRFTPLHGVVDPPERRGVAFGVPWYRAWPTGNLEQGVPCATTATPENRVRR
jgi:hypothetical protein